MARSPEWVMVYCWRAGPHRTAEDREREGLLLAAYDPEEADGRGGAEWTPDPGQALLFASPLDAYALWATVSTTRPLRDDGKPNRPLTAYTVSIQEVDR